MQDVTLELIELQTICLAYGETLIDEDKGEYKQVPDAFRAISNAWKKANIQSKDKIINIMGLKL